MVNHRLWEPPSQHLSHGYTHWPQGRGHPYPDIWLQVVHVFWAGTGGHWPTFPRPGDLSLYSRCWNVVQTMTHAKQCIVTLLTTGILCSGPFKFSSLVTQFQYSLKKSPWLLLLDDNTPSLRLHKLWILIKYGLWHDNIYIYMIMGILPRCNA